LAYTWESSGQVRTSRS